jgi:hypothetical protein
MKRYYARLSFNYNATNPNSISDKFIVFMFDNNNCMINLIDKKLCF